MRKYLFIVAFMFPVVSYGQSYDLAMQSITDMAKKDCPREAEHATESHQCFEKAQQKILAILNTQRADIRKKETPKEPKDIRVTGGDDAPEFFKEGYRVKMSLCASVCKLYMEKY